MEEDHCARARGFEIAFDCRVTKQPCGEFRQGHPLRRGASIWKPANRFIGEPD